jgi:hypothetical protein
MSIHEFPHKPGSSPVAAGDGTLVAMASVLERLVLEAKAAKQVPMLVYLLEVALAEAQMRLED